MPKVVSRTQASAGVLTGIMVVAAVYSAVVVSRLEHRLSDLTQDSTVADLGGLLSDIADFKGVLRRSRGDEDDPRPQIARRVDALGSRLDAIESVHAERIASDADGLAGLLELDRGVAELRRQTEDVAAADSTARLGGVAADMEHAVGSVLAVASRDVNRTMAAIGAPLASAYRTMMIMASLVALCFSALILGFVRSNRQLHGLARRDTLTGLQNRLTFSERLSALIREPGPGNEVAVMLLDVDLFKDINDTLGHAAGDTILKGIARRFETLATKNVLVFRLGGDEFAVILVDQQAHRVASDMVDKMTRLLSKPFDVGGHRILASVSIGVALTPMQWCDAETMLKNADIALYAAKAAGRGTFRFFNPRMDRDLRGRREMEEDLRTALAAGQLELHFQPIVDLKTHRIVSCEALARWNHPRHGYVPPMTFIALAEETGLIQEIGDWVMRQACLAAQSWPDTVRVSINLSPHQFEDGGLVEAVKRVLAETGLAAARVEFEITETILLRHSDSVLNALSGLRSLGVQIALDDFGTGYSSLSYLQRFSIDRIKIDQCFVRGMASSPEATAIVESICLLAAKLGIATTGEGIETEGHAAMLRGFGCSEGQGYHFDRPMPLAACVARIAGHGLHRDAA